MKRTRNIVVSVVIVIAIIFAVLVLSLQKHQQQDGDQRSVSAWLTPGVFKAAELPDQMNVLVIGTDRRRGQDRFHCDAIHMIHLDLAEETAEIVNVPRGTVTPIPIPEDWEPEEDVQDVQGVHIVQREEEGGDDGEEEGALHQTAYVLIDEGGDIDEKMLEELSERGVTDIVYESQGERQSRLHANAWSQEQYFANVCKYLDVDTFVERVERLTGYETDYRVLVGFSQAQSILQALQFDPVTTLQFLRHRQSYFIGDPQRSYNQAVFLRDVLTQKLDLAASVPPTVQFALYQLVDTDMPLPVAKALLDALQMSAINGDASRVTHRTEPRWTPRAEEMHYDAETGEEQVQELYDRLAALRPSFTVQDIQPALRSYNQTYLLGAYTSLVEGELEEAQEALDWVIELQSWRQLDDEAYRHRVMVEAAALQATITWMQTQDIEETLLWPQIMRGLLESEDAPQDVFNRLDAFLEVFLEPRL